MISELKCSKLKFAFQEERGKLKFAKQQIEVCVPGRVGKLEFAKQQPLERNKCRSANFSLQTEVCTPEWAGQTQVCKKAN